MVRVHPGSIHFGFRILDFGFDDGLASGGICESTAAYSNPKSEIRNPKCPSSSQSSPECSPPCQGGDRGFKSRQTRLNGTVRKLEKRRSSNLREFAGSTPALATEKMRRLGIGVPKWL
jgi:hypothetical protein